MTKQHNLDQARTEQTVRPHLETNLNDTPAPGKDLALPSRTAGRYAQDFPSFLEADRNEFYTRY